MPLRVSRLSGTFLLGLLLLLPMGCAPDQPIERVDLAVVLVVDQLTPALLARYDGAFDGGFRRLVDEGHLFVDAVHDHAITFTSPGHASPTTGVAPARHGIVGNSWREWREGEWQSVSSVADPDTELVGGTGSGSSPHNLLVDGLPDWIIQHDPSARVVSLSGKSTAGVLMGGRAPRVDPAAEPSDTRHVYWFEAGSEGFATSTHYRAELPDWVEDFNGGVVERYVRQGGGECWVSDLPPEVAALSRRDEADYEHDGVHTHFPHCLDDDQYRGEGHFISRTPALDAATLGLARVAVRALELGQRGAPDYLSVSLSAADRVGHQFGPYSREQLDNLVRLDREIGEFLAFLDEAVGRGRYVVTLTSDHGVLPLPEYLQEQGNFGLRLPSELNAELRRLAGEFGPSGAELQGQEVAGVRQSLVGRLEAIDWVEAAMPLELIASTEPADSFVTLYRNSFHPERLTTRMAAYGVETRAREGALQQATGTTHGVPYLHDRRVPLLFYGPQVAAGTSRGEARTVDHAPTLARLLGVPVPDGLDGRVLDFAGEGPALGEVSGQGPAPGGVSRQGPAAVGAALASSGHSPAPVDASAERASSGRSPAPIAASAEGSSRNGVSGEPPPKLLGTFEDDYGSRHEISADGWTHHATLRYRVVDWRSDDNFLIAQNDPSNPDDGELWTRIDWVELPGMEPWTWGFCVTEWQAASRADAEATAAPGRDTPRTGCNGHPFTRMQRVAMR